MSRSDREATPPGFARCAARAVAVAVLLAPALDAQATSRISVSAAGEQGMEASEDPSISGNGRFVAFVSAASNLVPGDTNGVGDVFVRDRLSGTLVRASVSSAGVQADGPSENPVLSADGRYVAFHSFATNLVPGDTNVMPDVFVRDLVAGTTSRVSVSSAGVQGSLESYDAAISADGRFVAFWSYAPNLVANDFNGHSDVFLHDRSFATTEILSVSDAGVFGNGWSAGPSISGDGSRVAFVSDASNLVAGDTNANVDIFVRDRVLATTTLVSVSSAGAQGDGWSGGPAISGNGGQVAFWSDATNLVPGDTNARRDVFVRDLQASLTTRASVSGSGAQANGASDLPSISGDGSRVAFHSRASNLVGGDTNGAEDAFVRDRYAGTTLLASVTSTGTPGNAGSYGPAISADGRFAAIGSDATDLVPGDSNGVTDVFVRDLSATPDFFVAFCFPGEHGVAACPCGNPPAGPQLGCDNSDLTGGATIGAGGAAYLSLDSVVVTTAYQRATAPSILLQGTLAVPGGIGFGQGVRCVDGTLKRLYVKPAVGGSFSAPGGSDPSISARSAALGDAIAPGQSRYYLVYYRDPVVPGACAAWRTFNVTPSLWASWWP